MISAFEVITKWPLSILATPTWNELLKYAIQFKGFLSYYVIVKNTCKFVSGIAIKGINLRQTCDEGLISTKIIILHFRSRYYLCFKFSSGQFFQAPEGASGVQSQRLPDGSKTKATPCAYCLPKDDAISVGHASKTGHSRLPKAKKDHEPVLLC